jgi:hypothetical protein
VEFDGITEENIENPVNVSGNVAQILIDFLLKEA